MTLRSRLVAVITLLLAGLGSRTLIARHLETRENSIAAALKRPLHEFPSRIQDWVGVDEPPDPEVLAMMKLDEHLQRVYRHPTGQEVVLWISYSKTSRDQYHYPTVCMQGHGWTEEESERALQTMPTDANGSRIRFRFAKPDRGRQYVYYWYYLIGESEIDRTMRKLSQSARLFLRGRSNASATVEIFSQNPSPDVKTLDAFAEEVARQLEKWIPDAAFAQSQLGANS